MILKLMLVKWEPVTLRCKQLNHLLQEKTRLSREDHKRSSVINAVSSTPFLEVYVVCMPIIVLNMSLVLFFLFSYFCETLNVIDMSCSVLGFPFVSRPLSWLLLF